MDTETLREGSRGRLAWIDRVEPIDPGRTAGHEGRARFLRRKERTPRGLGPWRRLSRWVLHHANRALFATPVGGWFHRRLALGRRMVEVDVPLGVGRVGGEALRVAFLSDLHAGLFMTAGDLVELAERVVARKPDLILLGGDLINSRAEEILLFGDALRVLKAPLGVFAVPGNHDYDRRGKLEPWSRFLTAHGVQVLVNRGARVSKDGARLWIAGVDDLTEGEPDLHSALFGRRPSEATVLLSHHPDLFVQAQGLDVDLQISGHTHGGQIRFFGWAPLVHSHHGFLSGLYRAGRSQLYVGQGTGVTVCPVRMGTQGELTFLRLEF